MPIGPNYLWNTMQVLPLICLTCVIKINLHIIRIMIFNSFILGNLGRYRTDHNDGGLREVPPITRVWVAGSLS
jgi:hypothetical protein